MPDAVSIDLIFVYGTLRSAAGHAAHRLLADGARRLGSGLARGRLYATPGYPALVPDAAGNAVTGEIYRLLDPRGTLERLDRYEGFDPVAPAEGEFRRTLLPVTMAAGRKVTAWTYVYQRSVSNLPPITHGDFIRYLHPAATAGAR